MQTVEVGVRHAGGVVPDKSTIGLAGEYYVLAQLAHRGLVGTLTLGNTKGVDIIVSDPDVSHLRKVEVKTSRSSLVNETLFPGGPFYKWQMSAKHESMDDPLLFFCFVLLGDYAKLPRFFIVPSAVVAQYVSWQHQFWLSAHQPGSVKDTPRRIFRIPHNDPDHYEGAWDSLRGPGV